jgi:hypothetical protein
VALAGLALLVAIASAAYTRMTAHVSTATLHDQHTLNQGPQDLEEVIVHRPQPNAPTGYWVGHVGETAEGDEVNLGPLGLGRQAGFALFYVHNDREPWELPLFCVPIECRKGKERWRLPEVLPTPREL